MPSDYLSAAMMDDPTDMTPERQRAIAEHLRGVSALGAMGSTSGIADVARSGLNAQKQASEMGRGMALSKSKREQEKLMREMEAGRMERADLDRAERAEDRALRRTLMGMRLDAQADKPQKFWRMTRAEREGLLGGRKDYESMKALRDTFKPEYANQGGFGFVERLAQRGMNREPVLTGAIIDSPIGRSLGVDSEALEAKQEGMEAGQNWWMFKKRMDELPARHAMFGVAISNKDRAEWEAAEINPGMKPPQIQAAMDARTTLANKWMTDTVNFYSTLGVNPETLDLIRSSLDPIEEGDSGVIMQQARDQHFGGGVPQAEMEEGGDDGTAYILDELGVSPEDWMSLDPEEQEWLLQNGGL